MGAHEMHEHTSYGAFTMWPQGTQAQPCKAVTPKQLQLLPPPLTNLI